MAYASAYKFLSVALNAALAREGVQVGNTADNRRVEIHDITENQPTDKALAVRVVTAVVECISPVSPEDAEQMNADNLAIIDGLAPSSEAYRIVGAVPTQLTETTEASDTAPVLYRCAQTIDFYIQQF